VRWRGRSAGMTTLALQQVCTDGLVKQKRLFVHGMRKLS
jgi:hypothetical protein